MVVFVTKVCQENPCLVCCMYERPGCQAWVNCGWPLPCVCFSRARQYGRTSSAKLASCTPRSGKKARGLGKTSQSAVQHLIQGLQLFSWMQALRSGLSCHLETTMTSYEFELNKAKGLLSFENFVYTLSCPTSTAGHQIMLFVPGKQTCVTQSPLF